MSNINITAEDIIKFISSKDMEIEILKQQYEAEQPLRTRLGERFEAQARLTKKREVTISNLKQLLKKAVEEIENCHGKETLLTKEIREQL